MKVAGSILVLCVAILQVPSALEGQTPSVLEPSFERHQGPPLFSYPIRSELGGPALLMVEVATIVTSYEACCQGSPGNFSCPNGSQGSPYGYMTPTGPKFCGISGPLASQSAD